MFGFGRNSKDPTTGSETPSGSRSGMFTRLKDGLSRTRNRFTAGLESLLSGGKTIDAGLLEEVEAQLLSADVGPEATDQVIRRLRQNLDRKKLADIDSFRQGLKAELTAILQPCNQPLEINLGQTPFVILMVGVNGVGKTTTIGKLTKRFQAEGKTVMLAAGDTFRAAAIEQLQVWGQRNGVPVIAQQTGSDSASVVFDALQSARAKSVDVLIADTAGRLHTKHNLMNELEKIVRVLRKQDASLPQEVMLVVDATTGQNAINQAERFNEASQLTGITLTKLDGTAKGGVVFALARKLELPIRFIGVGEQADDLRPFDAQEFVDALFSE